MTDLAPTELLKLADKLNKRLGTDMGLSIGPGFYEEVEEVIVALRQAASVERAPDREFEYRACLLLDQAAPAVERAEVAGERETTISVIASDPDFGEVASRKDCERLADAILAALTSPPRSEGVRASEVSSEVAAKLEGDSQSKNWIKAHLDYPHSDFCLLWPFGRSGGGYANFGSDHVSVHRLMCEHRHGPPPSPDHHAAHSCGRGKEGCVNPNHLDWKTPSENGLDRTRSGHVWNFSKLTVDQVDKIIAVKGTVPVALVAKEYGIGENAVRSIQQGRLWNGARERSRRIFTEDEIRLIRTLPRIKSARQFAEEFGVGINRIEYIRSNKGQHHE